MAGSTPPKKSGLSLYADLLKPSEPDSNAATISSAPVKYDLKKAEDDAIAAQKKKDASLIFQPIKRPQQQSKKSGKNGPSSSSAHKFSSSSVTAATTSSPEKSLPGSAGAVPSQRPAFQPSTIDDWIGDDDDDFGYQDRQRQQRQQRKWSKKKKKQGREARDWDWDDIYDPTQPNHYADYKRSEESTREIRDWKARLYYHHLKAEQKTGRALATSSDDEDDRRRRPANPMFAPPPTSSFAPPPNLNFAPPKFEDEATPQSMETDDDYYPPSLPPEPRDELPTEQPSFAQPAASDDATGDDAYMRRMRMSGMETDRPSPSVPPASDPSPPAQPTPPSIESPAALPPQIPQPSSPIPVSSAPVVPTAPAPDEDKAAKIAAAQAKIAAFKAKLGKPPSTPPVTAAAVPPPALADAPVPTIPATEIAPPPPAPTAEPPGSTISREPVRYVQKASPPPNPAEDENEMDLDEPATSFIQRNNNLPQNPNTDPAPRSNRPGQKGFGERLLMKYGWEKGQGLGAQGDGITTAIFAKADKRKKRPDAQGGGFATPANMGKIVGGKRRKVVPGEAGDAEGDGSKSSDSTSPVVKLEGLLAGLDVAREIEDNNLMQTIGERMGDAYGNVERLSIWREAAGGENQVFVKFTSALSALRAVNAPEGIAFAGNVVRAKFFDEDMFEKGEFE